MKAHDAKSEKSEELKLTLKTEKLKILLTQIVDEHFVKSDEKKALLKVLTWKKKTYEKERSAADILEEFRLNLEKAYPKINGRIPIYNTDDKKYHEKKLAYENIPEIFTRLKNDGVDAALSEVDSVIDFLKSIKLVNEGLKESQHSRGNK